MNVFSNAGIDPGYVIIALSCIVLVLIILYIVLFSKMKKMSNKYDKFMEGADGKNLESSILHKFKEIDDIKDVGLSNTKDIENIIESSKYCFQKFSITKYDAFKEMGGKLSFSLCMLTDNDDGFVLTSMYSNHEGCYTYIKEIIKGESYVILADEEKKVLQQAKSRRSCLDE